MTNRTQAPLHSPEFDELLRSIGEASTASRLSPAEAAFFYFQAPVSAIPLSDEPTTRIKLNKHTAITDTGLLATLSPGENYIWFVRNLTLKVMGVRRPDDRIHAEPSRKTPDDCDLQRAFGFSRDELLLNRVGLSSPQQAGEPSTALQRRLRNIASLIIVSLVLVPIIALAYGATVAVIGAIILFFSVLWLAVSRQGQRYTAGFRIVKPGSDRTTENLQFEGVHALTGRPTVKPDGSRNGQRVFKLTIGRKSFQVSEDVMQVLDNRRRYVMCMDDITEYGLSIEPLD